jgi:drug/metabolite transporter (DMT)-like permease
VAGGKFVSANTKRTAVLWLFGAMGSFATLDTIAKWLSQTMSIPVAVWFRYTIPTVLLALWLYRRGKFAAFHTGSLWLQIARGAVLVVSTLCFWTALKHLPLVEAATVSFIGPALTVVLSTLVLREKPEPIHWVALAMGFIGVLIVLRPGFSTPGVGALAALSSALFYSVYQILTRKVSGSHDSFVMLFYANAVGAAMLSTVVPAGLQWPQGWGWLGVCGLGFFGAFGHWCMIRAYEMADAPTLAPFMYSQLAITTVYGYFVFNTLPDGYTLLGMLVIIGSGLIVLLDLRRFGKPEPPPANEPE